MADDGGRVRKLCALVSRFRQGRAGTETRPYSGVRVNGLDGEPWGEAGNAFPAAAVQIKPVKLGG